VVLDEEGHAVALLDGQHRRVLRASPPDDRKAVAIAGI